MRILKVFLSFILGALFFIFLLFYMIIESWIIRAKESVKYNHLYNFRETDFPDLDVLPEENHTYEPLELGELPKKIGEKNIFTIPDQIVSAAKEILLDIQLNPSSNNTTFEVELELFDQSNRQKAEYIYLFHHPFEEDASNQFNTIPLWFNIPKDKKINLRLVNIIQEEDIQFKGNLQIISHR